MLVWGDGDSTAPVLGSRVFLQPLFQGHYSCPAVRRCVWSVSTPLFTANHGTSPSRRPWTIPLIREKRRKESGCPLFVHPRRPHPCLSSRQRAKFSQMGCAASTPCVGRRTRDSDPVDWASLSRILDGPRNAVPRGRTPRHTDVARRPRVTPQASPLNDAVNASASLEAHRQRRSLGTPPRGSPRANGLHASMSLDSGGELKSRSDSALLLPLPMSVSYDALAAPGGGDAPLPESRSASVHSSGTSVAADGLASAAFPWLRDQPSNPLQPPHL